MNDAQIYAEVYAVLDSLGEEYINKLPRKLYEFIDEIRDKKSIVEYDINKDIKEQDLSEEASNINAYLNLQYWCKEEEKNELLKKYLQNDKDIKEKIEKINEDLSKIKEPSEKENVKENKIIIKPKKSILQKIIEKIRHWMAH